MIEWFLCLFETFDEKAMKIAYHKFTTKKSNGGALYYYSEISKILNGLSNEGASIMQHEFRNLISSNPNELNNFVKSLDSEDVVVSNVGPYAHLYLYIRERFGGRFRIIRDVRTSSWSGFLLQEVLARPLTRPGDKILFPSNFCKQYFINLFDDSLYNECSSVCYPLFDSFPKQIPEKKNGQWPGLRMGYIGRISDDKNFSQVLEIFIQKCMDEQSKIELHCAGPVDPASTFKSIRSIKKYLAHRGVSADRFVYKGNLSYSLIWPFFRQIDVMLFPALSSVESLGRVILEAQYAGVPVVSADYAAASEILPPENLVKPVFRMNKSFDMIKPFSFGSISVDHALKSIDRAVPGEVRVTAREYKTETFVKHVLGPSMAIKCKQHNLTRSQKAFITSLDFREIDLRLGYQDALDAAGDLFYAYRAYASNRIYDRAKSLLAALRQRNEYPEQIGLQMARLLFPKEHMKLSNARTHCLAAGFKPRVILRNDIYSQWFPDALNGIDIGS